MQQDGCGLWEMGRFLKRSASTVSRELDWNFGVESDYVASLAVLRKQVKLALKFILDASMAMQLKLKLSGFEQVVVVASCRSLAHRWRNPATCKD